MIDPNPTEDNLFNSSSDHDMYDPMGNGGNYSDELNQFADDENLYDSETDMSADNSSNDSNDGHP